MMMPKTPLPAVKSLEHYYPIIRDWVIHNELHHKLHHYLSDKAGQIDDTASITISFQEFASQHAAAEKSKHQQSNI